MVPAIKSWGEEAEADDIGEGELPQTKVIGPDAKGIKTVIEYYYNDNDEIMQRTTKSRITKTIANVREGVIRRRNLPKFGQCARAGPGPESGVTMVSGDVINLRLAFRRVKKEEDKKKTTTSGRSLVVCRACGKQGDHFTNNCPYKDALMGQMNQSPSAVPASTSNKYVPPSQRGGAASAGPTQIQEPVLRIDNLSQEANDDDVRDLCRDYGRIPRVYIVRDKQTGLSRGTAYVTFESRDVADQARRALDKHGYDSLILSVDWAPPRRNA
eukprot:TRINITY_DN1750_c0_g1_i1.p1 TRINITY_DN1750_c0_g1~~TRINITY_DN1750_c0_g1_i1.p1  ORF type:complete len:270 (-),score=90.75 TRINITY_DN1750_c0_g1_i1:39-848(-)